MSNQAKFSTILTQDTSVGATVSLLNAIPSVEPPFYLTFDATNSNGHFEIVTVTSKTASSVLHGATLYDHSTEEEVRMAFIASEFDSIAASIATLVSNADICPRGAIMPFAGSSAPTGWFLCDGSAISRTTYASLFSLIGTTFGVGDGSTTFNLPNSKGRIPMGYDSGDASFDSIGETGGAKTANLQHSHTGNSHTHTSSIGSSAASTSSQQSNDTTSSFAVSSHTHTVTVNLAAGASSGSDNQLSTAQSILMPYLTLNWIIKA